MNELSGPPEVGSRVKDEPSGGSKSSESSESDSGSQGMTSMQPPTAIAYQTGSGTGKTFSYGNNNFFFVGFIEVLIYKFLFFLFDDVVLFLVDI